MPTPLYLYSITLARLHLQQLPHELPVVFIYQGSQDRPAPHTASPNAQQVMHYDELHALGSEHEVKAHGKYRQEGKAYEVKDGDVSTRGAIWGGEGGASTLCQDRDVIRALVLACLGSEMATAASTGRPVGAGKGTTWT